MTFTFLFLSNLVPRVFANQGHGQKFGTNLHFWCFRVHARREYNFTCLNSTLHHHHPQYNVQNYYVQFLSSDFQDGIRWGRGIRRATRFFKESSESFTNFNGKTQVAGLFLRQWLKLGQEEPNSLLLAARAGRKMALLTRSGLISQLYHGLYQAK